MALIFSLSFSLTFSFFGFICEKKLLGMGHTIPSMNMKEKYNEDKLSHYDLHGLFRCKANMLSPLRWPDLYLGKLPYIP